MGRSGLSPGPAAVLRAPPACRQRGSGRASDVVLIIRIDSEMESKAFGRLVAAGIPFKTWKNGETALPEPALTLLEKAGIGFQVIGPATYERLTPLRDLSPETV